MRHYVFFKTTAESILDNNRIYITNQKTKNGFTRLDRYYTVCQPWMNELANLF